MLWFLSFFFSFTLCFAEERAFFNEISKQPKQIQEKILERRLQFVSKKKIDLKIKDTVEAYLKIKNKNYEKKINFIIFLLNRVSEGKKVDIERKILSSTIHFCKSVQCIILLKNLPKVKNFEIFNKYIRAEILNQDLLSFYNYSPIIAKNPFLLKLFDKLIDDDKKNIKKILLLAYKFGKYEYFSKKSIEYKKKFNNKEWFKLKECSLFAIKKQYKRAKICFEKSEIKGKWLKYGYFYNSFLQGEKIKNENLEKFESTFSEREKPWAIIFKIFLSKGGTKEMFSNIDLNKFLERYEDGYYLLALNKNYHIFERKKSERLLKKYRRKFRGHFLERVLKGEVSNKKLAKYLGKNSSYYQYLNPHK